MGEVLAGLEPALRVRLGFAGMGVSAGQLATEDIPFNAAAHPRAANAVEALKLKARGVRISAVMTAPTVHGKGDHGFVKAADRDRAREARRRIHR